MKRVVVFGCWAALSACSSSSPTAVGDMMGPGPGSMDLASSASGIPDPGLGNQVDVAFDSVEPNDTPAQATPLGIAKMGNVVVWVDTNSTSGSDTTDYFVFKTASMSGQFSLGFDGICWMGAITNLTATLWKVAAGQQVMPPVHTWIGSGSCVKSMMGDAPLEASTEYLFAVTATGGSGTYSA